MLSFNSEARRILKKSWLWLVIIIASASVWLLGFFWAAQTPLTYTFRIWIGEESGFDKTLTELIKEECFNAGMKKCAINAYNPEDYHYGAAFALQANNVDIYVLQREEALVTAETEIFMPLGEISADKTVLKHNGKIIGLEFAKDYYVFINKASGKDTALLYAVTEILVGYGAQL